MQTLKRLFLRPSLLLLPLLSLLAGGCSGTPSEDDDDTSPVTGSGIAGEVAGTYKGDAVINYVPSTTYTATVARVDDDTIQVTGSGVDFTADLIQVDELITSKPGASVTIAFDTSLSPMTFDFVINASSDSFSGTRQ